MGVRQESDRERPPRDEAGGVSTSPGVGSSSGEKPLLQTPRDKSAARTDGATRVPPPDPGSGRRVCGGAGLGHLPPAPTSRALPFSIPSDEGRGPPTLADILSAARARDSDVRRPRVAPSPLDSGRVADPGARLTASGPPPRRRRRSSWVSPPSPSPSG